MATNVSKIAAERNQRTLLELVSQPGNDVCADCRTRTPRWASHSLGIFICVKCAAIHRKIGTHITKVKSLTLDTWTKEQVDRMKDMGNMRSNTYYHPDEVKHPLPTNMIEQERDSDLEKYIRNKYEFKKFIDKSAFVAAQLGPSRSKASIARPQTTTPVVAPSTSLSASATMPNLSKPGIFPESAPKPPSVAPIPRSVSLPMPASQQQQQQRPPPDVGSSTWNDLLSLQAPSTNPSLPLQYAPQPSPSMLPSSLQPPNHPNNFTSANGYLNSNPYAQQLSATPENPGLAMQPTGFNPMGTPSSFTGTSPFNNMQQSAPMGTPSSFNSFSGMQTSNPFHGQQFAGSSLPQSFQQQSFQSQNQLQPMMSMQPSPGNPFYTQQQQQPNLSMNQQQQQQPNPFMNQQQPNPFMNQQQQQQYVPSSSQFGQQQPVQMQQPGMFSPGNPFGTGWQGQPQQGGFPPQQQPWG